MKSGSSFHHKNKNKVNKMPTVIWDNNLCEQLIMNKNKHKSKC